MADTNKKEYTSNLHPKGDLGTTVYPNVKSENIIDKDTTEYTAGKVPDSSLVSRSLDGLNEKIETNKIQTETNKTNIATLQGDVAGLKTDNETTKTTVAGLVSSDTQNKANIASNTQNIENLSAVIPTDINVDSNYNLILEHDGTEITGQKKKLKYTIKYKENSRNFEILDGLGGQGISIFLNKDNGGLSYLYIGNVGYTHLEIYKTGNDDIQLGFNNTKIEFPRPLTKTRIYKLPGISGILALTSDIEGKQDKRFVHTVKISKPTDDGKTSITFTASSEKNTPIDSIQDLTTVFGNTDLSVSGATFLISSSQWEFYNKIHVGTSITDTTVDYINKDDVGTYNFIDMFGTTGFTITDNVTAM